MSDILPRSRRIRILRDEVSRKIAAGEVIDRPFSIVRELLDNAIDAGARSIDVHLEAGGLGRVRVVDDGIGMGPEDLALAWRQHATSKIENEDDLLRVTSLGFRGEALSSIAVCSRLEITSAREEDASAHRLEVRGGKSTGVEPCQGRRGSIVDVSELFFNYPARKKFLRSVSAESGLCRGIFIDRAVAHPDIAFRLFSDGELKLALPTAMLVERVGAAYGQLVDARLLGLAGGESEGVSVQIVAGSPDLRRRDRRLMQGFVNGRRVSEFALLQAVEFGYAGYIPGGWYPVAFVFVRIDPGMIDFNIHPAKKEVRFRNLPQVHKTIVAALQKMLEPRTRAEESTPGSHPSFDARVAAPRDTPSTSTTFEAHRGELSLPLWHDPVPMPPVDESSIRFLGQVFGVFLIFELPDRLIMMDQHAAHERIIFDRLGERAPALQELLFPLCFDVSDDEARRLDSELASLAEMGVGMHRAGQRSFEITALSADFKALHQEKLLELLRQDGGDEWRYSFRAGAACKMAIKEGERLDPVTARDLCEKALALPVARCPHGRPIWHEISRSDLLRMVDRPVT